MSISRKIVLGLSVMLILIVAGSLYTWSTTSRLTTIVGRLLSQEFPAVWTLDRIDADVDAMQTVETRLLSEDKPEGPEAFNDVQKRVERDLGELRALDYIPGSSEATGRLRETMSSLLQTEMDAARLASKGNDFDARQAATDAEELRSTVRTRSALLRKLYRDYIEDRESTNLSLAMYLRDHSIEFAVVSTLFAVFIMIAVVRSVLLPLRRLVRVSDSIAEGRTDLRADASSRDEFGHLARSFNSMVDNLHQRIEEVAAKNRILSQAEQDLQRQMRLAQQVQKRIVPRHATFEGLEVYTRIHAAKMVGGDFYDVQALDRSGQQFGLVIGDASGNGIPAALVMVLALTVMREASRQTYDPAQVFDRVNHGIREQFAEEMLEAYVTASYVTLDLSAMKLRVSNAGHEPSLLWKKASGQVIELEADGLFLGSFDSTEYESREHAVAPGDKVLMFTDGLTETRNADGDFFGKPRLIELMETFGYLPARELGDKIFEAATEFRGDPAPQDDVAVLIAEIADEASTEGEANVKIVGAGD
jgi:serine phosphatase RsbU (regulator of sigma subunit)